MLEYTVGTGHLARTRFVCSTLHEVMASIRVLADPGAHGMHLPWVREARPALAALNLELLPGIVPSTGYVPDFITPPPDSPLPDLRDELARMRATPPEQVRLEIGWTFPAGPPAELMPLIDDPEAALQRLADEVERWFAASLATHWPALRALLEADVTHRAGRVAEVGAEAMFGELHPGVRWESDGRLTLQIAHDAPVSIEGPGLVLMPSVFTWPQLHAITDRPWQTTLIYPARGVATAWEPVAPRRPDALGRVLGHSRAALLRALEVPRTHTQLAAVLALSPGAISQHVSVLRDAGLVVSHRDGRHVICRRTRLAEALLGS